MAFAVAADVIARTGWTLTPAETTQLDELLDDATEALRDAVGWQVSPPATATITTRVEGGRWIDLPPATTSVASVVIKTDPTVAGVAYGAWELVDGGLFRHCGWPCGTASITCTFGYPAVPKTLKRWAIVLAAPVFAQARSGGGLGGDGVTAVQIDDYREQRDATVATQAPMTIPDAVAEKLRSSFGLGSAVVIGERS